MIIYLGGANYDPIESKQYIYIYNTERLLVSYFYISFWMGIVLK